MRSSQCLCATVKSVARYLEPNIPTGLTGLHTHPTPRPALIYIYRKTLFKLQQLPSHSVYRQSTEALTKHRLKILEDIKPAGYEEWQVRVQKQIEANPTAYSKYQQSDGTLSMEQIIEERGVSWDGQYRRGDGMDEGANTRTAAEQKAKKVEQEMIKVDSADPDPPGIEDLEVEPPLYADQ